jgi:hypothetical protein
MSETPVDSNLKTTAALGKPRVTAIPPIALFAMGKAMADGEKKYGRFNWRPTGSTVSVFVDAMVRHLMAYYAGENYAPDSKIHHLGHIMAGCAILLDAELHGVLNDDRDHAHKHTLDQMMDLVEDTDDTTDYLEVIGVEKDGKLLVRQNGVVSKV